jgi:Na+/proline symporter
MKNQTSKDMFSAGGESPWWVSGLSAYMTMFSAGTFVVWGGIAYEKGAVAIAINCCYGVAAFFVGYFIAGRWKAIGVGTPAEFIELRFGYKVLLFYTWAMMVFRVVGTAVALYSLAVILVAIMPLDAGNPLQDPTTGNLSIIYAILFFGCIVVLYTMVGGLWAVLMTDVLQFIVLTLAVFLLVPLIWLKAGGWQGFVQAVPADFLKPVSDDYSLFFMAGWIMIHIFMIGAEWAFTQRFISVSSIKDAKKSAYLFGTLYIVSPILWMLPPMMYRAIDPHANPEQAYMLASQAVLPVGMIGLMVAAMFSATASLVSSQLNVFAGVLTLNIYQKLINPHASPHQQVFAGRVFTVLIGALLIGIAIAVPYMGGAEKVIISVTSLLVGPLLAPTIWGLLGRRIAASAVWTTAGVCFCTSIIVKYGLANEGFASGISGLSALSTWISTNPQSLDIVLGVVLPIVILSIMHNLHKTDAVGALRIDQSIEVERNKTAKKPSTMPALVVGIALLFCASIFYFVAILALEQKAILVLFATMVAVIGSGILALRHKQAKLLKSQLNQFECSVPARSKP